MRWFRRKPKREPRTKDMTRIDYAFTPRSEDGRLGHIATWCGVKA